MCGIAGSLRWKEPDSTAVIGRMTERLFHRGPDAGGVLPFGPAVLGHRRLSVIDLSQAANQPMTDGSGTLHIVFNGEIYNFAELRTRLEGLGARFHTRSDTEVILEAYRAWGVDCVQQFNGMFAFAIWDQARQRLFLARDRLGKKPLYFAQLADGLVFASELKAMLAHPQISRTISARGLSQYLSLNYTLTDACLVEGVDKLPPGHVLVMEKDAAPTIRSYWNLADRFRDKQSFRSPGEAADQLDALLCDSVRLRLISDVPVGAFLSGGIDSASIVSAMARVGGAAQTKSFSIGFNEVSYDESAAARATAMALGVDHHERIVWADPEGLPQLIAQLDEPVADTSIIPMLHLAAFARESVTVCLSGDGGDEVLAGYETYVADRLHAGLARLPAWLLSGTASAVNRALPVSLSKVSFDYKVRRFFASIGFSAERAHYSWRLIMDDAEKASLLNARCRDGVMAHDPWTSFAGFYAQSQGCHALDQALYVDIKTWLADDILVKVDRTSMAHALETRAPFLDYRVVEFCAALPPEWKLKGLETKHLLRASQRRNLPRGVLKRRKQGFNSPVSRWLTGELREIARDVTLGSALTEWFDKNTVESLWKDHLSGRRDNGLKLFGLLYLGLWLDNGTGSR